MSNFNIGDSVEVLPAPEEAGFTWRMVARRRGRVVGKDPSRDCHRTVGVLFLNGDVYFCDPAWLRLVKRAPSPSPDAPSRPQGARPGPSEGKPDSRAIGEPTPVAGPRYKVGDRVDGDEFEGGVVTSVETEPIYVVRWPSGYVQRVKESLLSPHKPAPVVCTPDGALCSKAERGGLSLNWDYCPYCGGRLKEGG